MILSDALLGRENREAVTSVRYNFKPDTPQVDKIMQPAEDASSNSYNLAFTEESDEFAYQGIRQPGEGQYVLIFSPEQEAFILHQVDSTFNMNVISTPWDQDADSLRTTYAQLTDTPVVPEITTTTTTKRRKAEPKPKAQTRSQAKSQAKAPPKTQANRAQHKKAKAAIAQREATPEEEESEDDGLKIEYPDEPPRRRSMPTLHESEQHQTERESSDEDSDIDEDERHRDVDDFLLPSPAHNQDSHDHDDMDLDLEAELEQALDLEIDGGADESSESEEE